MKFLNKLVLISSVIVVSASCKKSEDLNLPQPVGLGGDVVARTAIDKWLLDSLTTPYNIAVKYRWDPWELNLNKTLTPPEESRIIPAMSALKRVWIDPYNAETGSDLFMKKYSPKQFVLVGSVEYNYNGTVLLGQAEGGNNIAYFDINQNFDQNSVRSIQRIIQTSHHEFAHVLHQTVVYPQEYKFISSNLGLPGFTATWFNVSPAQALAWGYITPYSMASSDEDFVEMIANMLMLGKSRYEEVVASTNAKAKEALRTKEQIVVTYFRQVWNIDFYSLQTRVQAALNALVPPPVVADAYGFDKPFTRASVNPAPTNQAFLPQPASFMAIYNSAKAGLAAVGGAGRVLDSFAVIQNSSSTALLRLYYRNAAGNPFQANYTYAVTRDASNVYTYTYGGADANGTLILSGVTALVNYFDTNKFTLSWYRDPSVSLYPRIQFTPQASPGTYFLARLLP